MKIAELLHPPPLYRRELKTMPGMPLGTRVLLRPGEPEKKTEGGLVVPETALRRVFQGRLVAASDQAADKLYDLGVQIGDEVWYSKYAGIIQEWQTMITDDDNCPHDGSWDYVPQEDQAWKRHGLFRGMETKLRRCRACQALRLSEQLIVADVDDLILSVDLAIRLEAGTMQRVRMKDANGATRYVTERLEEPDTFEIKER